MQFKIVYNIDRDTNFKGIEYSDPLYLYDIFYLEIDGISFPAKSWEDYLLSIISEWLMTAVELMEKNKAEFNFMDDAYKMVVSYDKNNVKVSCLHYGFEKYFIEEKVIPIATFMNEILKTGKEISLFFKNKVNNREIENLSNRVFGLEKRLKEKGL